MQFLSRGMRIVLALGLIACTACLPKRQELRVQPGRDRAIAGVYAKWRFIGIRSAGLSSCPDAGAGWKGTPLFPIARRPYKDPAALAVLEHLERFCVYEPAEGPRAAARRASAAGRWNPWFDRRGEAKDLPALPPPPRPGPDLVRVDPDEAALATSASSDDLPGMSAALLKEQFERQAGRVQQLPAPLPPLTRLTFLDTQPTGMGVPDKQGNSGHGYTLAHMGGELVCGDPPAGKPCAQIATQLALPLVGFDAQSPENSPTDETHGGYFGFLGDLAHAISAAVAAWHDCGPGCPGGAKHLVLNLSLGWDGGAYGDLGDLQVHTPVEAVYWALKWAAVQDVLVVAAAGNVNGHTPSAAGPILPAAWEDGRPPPEVDTNSLAGPLLYAVGALQADGQPLGNMRPGGMPPRAAFGDHAVVADGKLLLPAITGTSVAAVVVSAAAAVVWDYQPGLDRNEVMDRVTQGGTSLGYAADFGWRPISTPMSSDTHRVTLCAALAKACAGGACGSSWPPPSGCPTTEDPNFWTNLNQAQVRFHANKWLDGAQFHAAPLPWPVCSSGMMHYATGGLPAYPCPDEESPAIDAAPWVYPQPDQDPCPTCTVGRAAAQSVSNAFRSLPQQALSAGGGNGLQPRFVRIASIPAGTGGTDATGLSNSPPSELWTLRLKIRDGWSPCLTAATLDLDLSDQTRISYAIDGKLCGGCSREISGIAVPAGLTVKSAWLSFLENGLALRSQLLLEPQ